MRFFGYIAVLLCVPIFAHAQVVITEIMYAPDGADAGREWIEVCNSGSEETDIASWKFFENDTNHGLTLISGGSNIHAGACAVFADDADMFVGDYPTYSGNLFDSAFSLKNTGETLELRDEAGNTVDSVTYTDTHGAKDNGLSLHINGSAIVEMSPTPGSHVSSNESSENSTGGTETEVTTQISNVTTYSYEALSVEPPQDVYVRVPDAIITTAGAFTKFTLESYDARGQVVEDGNVYWSFGDGSKSSGRTVSHQYQYEGAYIVSVTLSRRSLSDTQQITVTVVPLQAQLLVADDGEWVAIENKSIHQLDVSLWRLKSSNQYFKIPDNTVLPPGSVVRFSTQVTGLTTLKGTQRAFLVYPDGSVALDSSILPTFNETEPVTEDVETVVKETIYQRKETPVLSVIGVPVPSEHSERIAAPKPTAVPVENDKVDISTSTQLATAVLGSSDKSGADDVYWYLGLAAVIALAVAALMLRQPERLIVDGFEVVESKE